MTHRSRWPFRRASGGKKDRWSPLGASGDLARLQTVAKGQEFVIDLGVNAASEWLTSLFRVTGSR